MKFYTSGNIIKNDVKVIGKEYFRYDGTRWRTLCQICHREARKNLLCKIHLNSKTPCKSLSCKFMDELSVLWGKHIIHHHVNDYNVFIGQEKRFGSFKVDGFIEDENISIEFLGDYWHGNGNFYNQTLKKSSSELLESTLNRLKELSKFTTVYYIWESDYISKNRPLGEILFRVD